MPDSSLADTVVVACGAAESSQRIVGILSDAGVSVIGPVDSARMALALAAQTPFTLAVVDSQLSGERDGRNLAEALMSTWGVRSVLMDDESEGDEAWRADCALSNRVRRALAEARA